MCYGSFSSYGTPFCKFFCKKFLIVSHLSKNEEALLSDGGKEIGQEQRMVVLRSGHHVQKLIASRPNVLKLVFLHFYSS